MNKIKLPELDLDKNMRHLKKNILPLSIVSMLLFFSLYGDEIWVSHLNQENIGFSWIWYIEKIGLAAIVVCAVYICVFLCLGKIVCNDTCAVGKYSRFFFGLIPFLSAGIYWLAFNPAIMTSMTYIEIKQALGVIPLDDWHPIGFTFLIRILLSIWDSPVILVAFQIVVNTIITSGIFIYLSKHGLNIKVALCLCVFISLFPNNAILNITIWNDVLYTYGLLMLVFAWFLLTREEDNYISWFIWGNVFVCLARHNGAIVCIFTFVLLLLYKSAKVRCVLFFCILTICFPFLVQKICDINESAKINKYFALTNDIIGVYYYDGRINSSTEEFLKELLEQSERKNYHVGSVRNKLWNREALEKENIISFLNMYVDTWKNNKILMTKIILTRLDPLWDMNVGKNAKSNSLWRSDYGEDNLLIQYPERKENFLTDILTQIGVWSMNGNRFYIFWRVAPYAILIALGLIHYPNKKRGLVIISPVLINMCSLCVALGWSDYRYWWNIAYISIYFCLFSFVEAKFD